MNKIKNAFNETIRDLCSSKDIVEVVSVSSGIGTFIIVIAMVITFFEVFVESILPFGVFIIVCLFTVAFAVVLGLFTAVLTNNILEQFKNE